MLSIIMPLYYGFAAYFQGFLKFLPYLFTSSKVGLNGREDAAIENCGKFAKK
jgi:hypothetical protein